MRTREEWFNLLSEPDRTRAFENLWISEEYNTEKCKLILSEEEPTMWGAIAGGFVWSSTPEGNNHWKELAESYENDQ